MNKLGEEAPGPRISLGHLFCRPFFLIWRRGPLGPSFPQRGRGFPPHAGRAHRGRWGPDR
ncbi:protein of unknown function (plasmid) [Azospirillum baldaniorum]|uniref:Uncharacterized protein n=1 Tax=Azospirillum baldaniorum TaxID=1064539 RepID=A0A9P1JX01_9PROT|nr:protein of unknown function [Azospirillum baldaniorum]